jgi:hypothetical protein
MVIPVQYSYDGVSIVFGPNSELELDDLEFEDNPYDWEPPELDDEMWEVQRLLEYNKQKYALYPSDFVSEFIRFPDPNSRELTPFDYASRPYIRAIHNCSHKNILMMTSRQVEKSTTLAIRSYILTCLIPHFRVLYVSPSSTQTKQFSNDRLKELRETCAELRTWYPNALMDNVFEKKAINRSQITLRYAYLNADRCRGLSADSIFIDEFQDILLDNIPVIVEASSHSRFRYLMYSGTPKSQDNPIEHYWANASSQNEWAVPCERHGRPSDPRTWHWNILGENNIGREGLICDKCGKPISAAHPLAKWVRTSPIPTDETRFEGFRISQLMVPWIHWNDILAKYRDYPRARFMNEVLGRSFDSGQRPLSQDDLRANCDPELKMAADAVQAILAKTNSPIYAGVDWGQDSTKSYTVLVLATYVNGFFTVFFAHRFEGSEMDPGVQVDKIKRFIRQFKIRRCGVDYGGGHHPNAELLKEFGRDRIVKFQYATTKGLWRYDEEIDRYKVHKHEMMSVVFNAIKSGKVFRFPCWEEWQDPFGSDMLSIFSEYNERTRLTEYKKSLNATDDTMHAVIFAFLASYKENPRPELVRPSIIVDRAAALRKALLES